jgi:hypothetical protein
MTLVAAPGFGPLQISDLTINGAKIPVDFHNAITNVIVQRNIKGASTLTLQLTDPHREIIRSPNFLSQGATIEIPDGFGNYLQFVFVQSAKSSDQLQVSFEARSVYDLRNVRGVMNSSDVTDAASFVQNICSQHGIPFVGPAGNPYINPKLYAASTGGTADPNEDAWTSFQRIAGTLGWRCWESAGTIFFGPDEYWFNSTTPPVNNYYNHGIPTLKEWTDDIQLMDFDWDVGTQFGDMTITCMSHFWQYNPGEIVYISGLGPADGGWLVSSMQRDF